MTFALPWIFALGVAVAGGVVGLHLLSTRRPPARPLPTARFVPESDLRAVSRTSRPTDLFLLALRVLAVLLIAAAFAQPIPDAPGPSLRRVVALEWTTAIVDVEAARARAQALLGEGDALVVFDTGARVLPASALATLAAPTQRAVALSPMFVAARDAAREIARGADSLALTVVSGFPAEAWDAATAALRDEWNGRIEVVRVATAVDSAAASSPQLMPRDADDPIAAALDAVSRGGHPVRIQRDESVGASALSESDSLWLAQTPGALLLHWPRPREAALGADGVYASLGGSAALVAPLARRELGATDAMGAASDAASVSSMRSIAFWRDGTPAATERPVGLGCVREIGITIPERGDVTLREPFRQLLAVLTEPCGGRRSRSPSDSVLTAFAGDGPLVSAAAFEHERAGSPLTPWLLLAALGALLAEQWWRQRGARA